MIVVKFGLSGFLREGSLIGSLMDAGIMPIIQTFGKQSLFNKYMNIYYNDAKGYVVSSHHATTLMENLFAILFWQHILKDKNRLQ